jgi:hemolysin activation/secretion protein
MSVRKNIQSQSKRFNILILNLVAVLFFSHSSNAQSVDQNAINQQDWITRQQQNILEEKKRNSEFETIKKERERKKKEEEEESQKSEQKVLAKTTVCFPIKEIKLTGADSLSWFRKKRLTKPFVGKCFEAKVLSDLITSINTYYQSKGYVTTQVVMPKQNLQSGIFELQIIEGKIEKISLGKDRVIDKMQKFTAFENLGRGDVLNINDINQGMYQLNRLQSNQAVMNVEPGDVKGESQIIITNNKRFPARLTVGKDNLGNKFTGVQRTNLSAGIDNLLFLNDNINLSYSTNTHDDSQLKDIKSFSNGISVPLGYNTFSYDYSRSEFKGTNPGANGPTTLTGFSDQNKVTLDRVLLNNTNFRLSTNASLTAKQSASYLNGDKIETSERKLSILNAGFAVSSYLNDTTNIYLKPSYSKGLKVLNAKKDQASLTADTPRAQFEVFKLYANFSKRFTIPKINAPVTFSTEMDSQYSKDTLFGSEQFSVGGYYSVRGFRENYITGDSGYYLRNKINFNLGSFVLPFLTKADASNNPQGFFSKNLVHLNKFSFEPFYDYGYIRNKYDGSDGRLAGAGIKSIFSSRYFNASLTYSQGTNRSKLITSTVKENKLVYFEISASCC